MVRPFSDARDAARAVLKAAWAGECRLTSKAASFTAQVSVSADPLTQRQAEWLEQILDRAGLPPFDNGGRHD